MALCPKIFLMVCSTCVPNFMLNHQTHNSVKIFHISAALVGNQCADAFAFHVSGIAETWYATLPASLQTEWPALKEACRQRFAISQHGRWRQERDLYTLRQQPGQDVASFTAVVLKAARGLEMTQAQLVRLVLGGLHTTVTPFVEITQPTTVDELLRCPAARNGMAAPAIERDVMAYDSGRPTSEACVQAEQDASGVNAFSGRYSQDRSGSQRGQSDGYRPDHRHGNAQLCEETTVSRRIRDGNHGNNGTNAVRLVEVGGVRETGIVVLILGSALGATEPAILFHNVVRQGGEGTCLLEPLVVAERRRDPAGKIRGANIVSLVYQYIKQL